MFNKLEENVKELDGIYSCKITGDEKVDEIHIIASKNRDPKRIVRDIETIVMVNLDYEISHKKISIAQVHKKKTHNIDERIEIITIYKENNSSKFHFKLNINDEIVEKVISKKLNVMPVSIAEGMVDITLKYTSFPNIINIKNVFTTGIDNNIVIVQLLLNSKNSFSQERLIGAAYVNQNLPLAVGKATLNALNRKINDYL